MWRAPSRPKDKISQSFSDGVVLIYAVEDDAPAGLKPQPVLHPKARLRFDRRRIGVQRYYAAKQNLTEVEQVLRVPEGGAPIVNQDVAIIAGSTIQYRIDLVQTVPDAWPACLDLSLTRIGQPYPTPPISPEEWDEYVVFLARRSSRADGEEAEADGMV